MTFTWYGSAKTFHSIRRTFSQFLRDEDVTEPTGRRPSVSSSSGVQGAARNPCPIASVRQW